MKHLMRFSALIIIVVSLSLAGCLNAVGMFYEHTMQAYEGDKRPRNETSILKSKYCEIVSFDARQLHPDSPSWEEFFGIYFYEVEMLPGSHTVIIHYSDWDWMNTNVYRNITFVSEAGHDYTARSEKHCPNSWDVAIWIEDNTNGQVVAGRGPCEEEDSSEDDF